jgi:hypothetical protein
MESPTESLLPRPPDSSGSHGSLRADTTAEQDRKTAGQRNVNIIWELTQAFIAIGITAAEIYVSITGKPSPSIDNAFTLIVAIYFVRMNHTKQGGIGGSESRDSR